MAALDKVILLLGWSNGLVKFCFYSVNIISNGFLSFDHPVIDYSCINSV